ncbi:MAG: alkaline phosphatase D family protein [Pirellulaceae bacterium]|nr:alkaline phosphatase D family protein [Pirellulaceae bacterium]
MRIHFFISSVLAICFSMQCTLRGFAQPASKNIAPPSPPLDAGQPSAGMGIMVGEVSDSSALVQVRLTQADQSVDRVVAGAWGVVEFTLRTDGATASVQTLRARALPHRDFIARVEFKGLKAGVRYQCSTRIGVSDDTLRPGPSAEFRTCFGPSMSDVVRLVVVTGMNYAKFHGDDRIDPLQHRIENNTDLPQPYAGPDKHLGYPSLASILNLKPQFFVGTGDNVYYDTPDNPRAQSVSEMRQKWHEQFIQPRYRELFAQVPTYWMVDDHDYRIDDGDNEGEYLPLPETGRRVLLEQLPYAPTNEPAATTYRTHRLSKDLQIWLPENRFYRSPNSAPDGPDKTIWGVEQKQWLMKTLVESDATFKLLISPTPMIGPDDLRKKDNHCDVGGFQHERDEFFQFLKANQLDRQNFFLVCGDRHWQYHALDSTGFEEFSCGALVDANARLGRMPGDPLGTDPQGLIRHLHTQKERSGGFLLIRCDPAQDNLSTRLSFVFHDELGNILYQHQITK